MDIFAHLYSTLKYSTEIYNSLFQASIALAGFIAVFLVFRYQTLDNRVDHRKDILRWLLNDQIKIAPYIAVIIQNMNEEAKDPEDLCKKIKDELKNINKINAKTKKALKEIGEKNTETEKAVKKFASEIYGYKRFRDIIVYFGITCISIWSILSLKYLFILSIGHYLFNKICCSEIIFLFSIRLFTFSVFLSLAFIIISLIGKAEWFYKKK